KGLILLKSFTFYHSNSLLTSVDCYTLLKSKFFATVPVQGTKATISGVELYRMLKKNTLL
ncbi:hypothetical protein, partial [Piscirickettsia salmonis]|uniref:hypothetical protein n=1 Tax=Piscirickettsia salmonis TaxID=1238 RepID=UPI003EBB5522